MKTCPAIPCPLPTVALPATPTRPGFTRLLRWQPAAPPKPVRPVPREAPAPGLDPRALCALADHPPHLLRDIGLSPAEQARLQGLAALRGLRWQLDLP